MAAAAAARSEVVATAGHEDVLAEADLSVQQAARATRQLVELLRRQAGEVDARLSSFVGHERDLAELIGHSEHLANELERARPGTPAHKNAQEASRRAITRMFKVLSAQEVTLRELAPFLAGLLEKQATRVQEALAAIAGAREYVTSYRASAKAYEADEGAGEVAPETGEEPRSRGERGDRGERGGEKDRKKEKKSRSKSPAKERRARGSGGDPRYL